MTNRTIRIHGYGYSSTPATISVTLDGIEIFNGEITTVDSPPPTLPDFTINPIVLCSFTLPVSFTGIKPMTCTVTNGTVLFANIDANYCVNTHFSSEDLAVLNNPSSTAAERLALISPRANPPFTSEEETILLTSTNQDEINTLLLAHKVEYRPDTSFSKVGELNDPRTDVAINGSPIIVVDRAELTGAWWYLVDSGSTLSYNLNVVAGAE